jgi:hypothetical protein
VDGLSSLYEACSDPVLIQQVRLGGLIHEYAKIA